MIGAKRGATSTLYILPLPEGSAVASAVDDEWENEDYQKSG